MMALLLFSGFSGVQAATVQDDMGSGGDASNSRGEIATTIMVLEVDEMEGTGYLDEEDTVDWYSVAIGFHKRISFVMTPSEGSDFDLRVRQLYGIDETSSTAGSATESVEAESAAGLLGYEHDTFYIEVTRQSGSGTYSLSISWTETWPQDDMGSGGDAGSEIGEATEIEPGTGSGWTNSYLRYDFYKIQVSPGQTVDVEVTSTTGDYVLLLFDHFQYRVDVEDFDRVKEIPATVTWTATSPGYFYIEVRHMSNAGYYQMTVNRAGNEPPEAMFEWWMEGDTLWVADFSGDVDGEVAENRWYIDGELQANQIYEELVWLWEEAPEGEYEITLIVVDDKGAESEPFTQTVTVIHIPNQPPEANFEWWVEDYNMLALDARGSTDSDGEIVEYHWYLDGEMVEDSLDWDGITWEDVPVGVYEFMLVVVDDLGAESEPVSATVEIEEPPNQPPEAIFNWHLEEGTLVVDASGSSDDGRIVDYRWFLDGKEDESFGGAASWEWANIEAGSYDITLHVFDEEGEEDMYRMTVTIADRDPPPPDPPGGIPGFPILSVLSGAILGLLLLRGLGSSKDGIIKLLP